MRHRKQDPDLKNREVGEFRIQRLIATIIFVVCSGMGLWAVTLRTYYYWHPPRMTTPEGIIQLDGEQAVLMGLGQMLFGALAVLLWIPLRDAWRVWVNGSAIIAFCTAALVVYLRFF